MYNALATNRILCCIFVLKNTQQEVEYLIHHPKQSNRLSSPNYLRAKAG